MALKKTIIPYMGMRFWPLSVIFWPIVLKCFMGTQETIIYRLAMRNHDLDVFLKYIFGGKRGVAATLVPKGLGPHVPAKKLAHWADLLSQSLSHKNVFKKLGPELAIIYMSLNKAKLNLYSINNPFTDSWCRGAVL